MMTKLFFGFRGTDTHGMKAFRLEKVVDIVQQCKTDKDILASELILRMQRAGLYMSEIPVEIDEIRAAPVNLLNRVPSAIKNLVKLWLAIRGRAKDSGTESIENQAEG